MSDRVALTHVIEVHYGGIQSLPTHWLRLRPAPHTKSAIEAYSLRIGAEPHFVNWLRDPFGNFVARLDLPKPIGRLSVTVDFIANLAPVNPFDFLTEPDAARFPFDYSEQLQKELRPYLYRPLPGPRVAAYLEDLDRQPAYVVDKLSAVAASIAGVLPLAGDARFEVPDLEIAFNRGTASPWELAWLLTIALRHLGLAARFTSGYRIDWLPGVAAARTESLSSAAALPTQPISRALHAWSEVFVPGCGWIGLDPSTGLFAHQGHVPLSATPDPQRSLPLAVEAEPPAKPKLTPGRTQFDTRERIAVCLLSAEPAAVPPVTLATEPEIEKAGLRIDRRLAEADIGLTTGASICFTAIASDAPEWTTLGTGPEKRSVAEALLAGLARAVGPGGIVHVSQGEWYAGEPLPRWRLNCFYRTDGVPIGGATALKREPAAERQLASGQSTASGGAAARTLRPKRAGIGQAKLFAESVAARLGLASEYIMPAHEDQLYELWLNRAHIHFEPPSAMLGDPEQRRALATQLSQNCHDPVGYVLPLAWDGAKGRWTSSRWKFRRDGLFLTPGRSPLGYRLPLDALTAAADERMEFDPERCPFEDRPPLAKALADLQLLGELPRPEHLLDSAVEADDTSRAVRTALCVELRDGELAVFLPPIARLEVWLQLIEAVFACADQLGSALKLEGYEPPEDYRLGRIHLEPDAGVLRVELPMVGTATECSSLLKAVYREAERCGLRAERSTPDGFNQPPGGSARLVLGGNRPAASPFLNRPGLLASIIAFWQRHPSLSYFFASRPVGPAGAASRPDEARSEGLYELSIALSRLTCPNVALGPWAGDRALRHLLVDGSGQTRNSELGMDRLYPPDRAVNRQGWIELRGFDSAPDVESALLQVLLVRAIVAMLADKPKNIQMIRWRTELFDRFMLPAPLWDDLGQVLDELQAAGLGLSVEWFRPSLDRRFPVLGESRFGDIGLELRLGLEPWPLLAEEVAGGQLGRCVDSANQRVQVQLTGSIPNRHVLLCNGQRVPLKGAGSLGNYFAGVRYKAWNPPSTLHPTLPPIQSLVFDLVDTGTGEVLGGCTWVPSRPTLSGPMRVLPPRALDFTGPVPPPAPLRSPAPTVAYWSNAGRFLNFGSGASKLPIALDAVTRSAGNLLDLTRPAT